MHSLSFRFSRFDICVQLAHWGSAGTVPVRKRNRTGQKEKVKYNKVARETSANPLKSSQAGVNFCERAQLWSSGDDPLSWVNSPQRVTWTLAGVTQWTEYQPSNQRVTGWIPSLGHMTGLWTRSPVGGTPEATTHWCFSPSLSPSFSLSKINK